MPEAKPRANPDRDRRRKIFLRALAAGQSVLVAAEDAGIAWSTLYAWRRDAPKFRAAWDRAAELARGALADRFQSALIQRAVDGVDEPVFHAGRLVGTRKRYSDALLLAGLQAMKPAVPSPAGADQKRLNVIIRPFGDFDDTEMVKPAPPPVVTAAAEPAAATPEAEVLPPDPDVPLRWDHLNNRDTPDPW